MNQTLVYILVGTVAGVLLLVIGVHALFPAKTPSPAPTSTMPPVGGGSDGSQYVGTKAQSKEAVQAAYAALLSASNPDNIQVQGTVIVGEYALQDWSGNITGGEALLKYNGAQDTWALVVSTGGVWSADELVQYEDVPADIAAQLVAGAASNQ